MDSGDSGAAGRGDREFFRVRASIPIRVEPVDPAHYQHLASEVLARVDPPLPEGDAALICWLDRIERKLNTLLRHHGLLEGAVVDAIERRTVELSGSGLSFSSPDGFEIGSSLLLELELPEAPTRLVRCLGRVVAASSAGEGGAHEEAEAHARAETHEIGVRFETIRQADRDAMVRYTLAVQRQTILEASRDAGSST